MIPFVSYAQVQRSGGSEKYITVYKTLISGVCWNKGVFLEVCVLVQILSSSCFFGSKRKLQRLCANIYLFIGTANLVIFMMRITLSNI